MTCDSCPHLITRKFANGTEMHVDLFCDIDHFCVSSIRFPLVECSRKKVPVVEYVPPPEIVEPEPIDPRYTKKVILEGGQMPGFVTGYDDPKEYLSRKPAFECDHARTTAAGGTVHDGKCVVCHEEILKKKKGWPKGKKRG